MLGSGRGWSDVFRAWTGQRFLRRAVIAVVATALSATAVDVARAQTIFEITGTVADAIGRPLVGATVDDGGQYVRTDSLGRYVLREQIPGTYTLHAHRVDTQIASSTVDATVPTDKTASFALTYLTVARPQPTAVQPGQPITFAIDSAAPDASPVCVRVSDPFFGEHAATATSQVGTWGTHVWSYATSAPQSAAQGPYPFDVSVRDCGTGTELSHTLGWVVVDSTAPSIVAPPARWYQTSSPTVRFRVADSGAAPSGLDPASVRASIDGTPAQVNLDGYAGLADVLSPHVADGLHVLALSVADFAGNNATATVNVGVDTSAPTLSAGTPNGRASSTPRLSVRAVDRGSGVDPSTGSFDIIWNGLLYSNVAAAYTPSDGSLTYQVPTVPTGIGIGRFPLPPGNYTITAHVSDHAGNVAELTWAFAVPVVATASLSS